MKRIGATKRSILFIDTGDNCRCPMAHGYLLKLLEQRGHKHIDIKTAGVMTPTGLLPTPEAVQLLQEEGVDIRRHRSRPLTGDMIKKADLVLGMTPFHVQSAFRMTEEARGKTFLLKEYVGREGRNTQIADPMGGTLEIFKKCFAEIRASLQRLVDMDIIKIVPENFEEPKPPPPAVPARSEEVEAKPKKHAAEKAPAAKSAKPAKAKSKAPAKAKTKASAKPKAAKPAAKKAAQPKKTKPAAKVTKKAAKPAPAKKPAPKKAPAKAAAAKSKSKKK